MASSHQGGNWDGSNEHKQVIRFWDVATGKQLRETTLEDEGDSHIVFSPDGKLLAVATHRQGVWLIDADTGKSSGESMLGGWPLAFTSDSKGLLACSVNQKQSFLELCKISTRNSLNTIGMAKVNPNADLTFASFSRDGRLLACIEEPGTVHLVEVNTNKELATLRGRQVVAIVFSPDNSKLVTAGKDKVIRVWEANTGKELCQLGQMAELPAFVDFLPNGKTVLAACSGQIRRWDVGTGKETQPALHCKGLLSPRLLSADGTKLVERVRDTLSIWDTATGKEIDSAAGAPRSSMNLLAFSPDGRTLATIERLGESEVNFWDVITGKPRGSLAAFPGKSGMWNLAWPLHDTLFGQLVEDGAFHVYRWTKADTGKPAVKPDVLDGVGFSPDGRVVARLQGDGVELLDVTTGKKLSTLPSLPVQSPREVICSPLVFSGDHRFLATHSFREPMVELWEVSTGHKLYSFNLPEHTESNLEQDKYDRLIGFSPDGRLIVTQGIWTKAVSLWEHVTGQLRLCLPMPPECIRAENNVAFSLDGRLLAIGYVSRAKEERSIHVYDLATGKECQCFRGHKAGVGIAGAPLVVFSPDGRRLASAGVDYTALIWDVQAPALKKQGQPLDQQELHVLKTALVDGEAAAAYRAMCRLRQVPEQAVTLAAECLAVAPESKLLTSQMNNLIGDLDNDNFQIRMKAAEFLRGKLHTEEYKLAVETHLCQALKKKPSVEVSRAITKLLDELKEEQKRGGALSPELTRMYRGIELLELIHNDAARGLLQGLVAASPRPEVRQEAEAALKRLATLPPSLPAKP